MKKGILFLVLLATVGAFMFSLEGCDHHDPDPCLGLEPITAKFSIKEPVADTTFVTDTVFAGAPTIFEADQDYTSYLWRVGNDPRTWTTKSFSLTFDQPLGNVPVTLIVQKLPNKTCFPKDNGIDTLVKTFYVKQYVKGPSKFVGNYEGFEVGNETSAYTVRIKYEDIDPPHKLLAHTIYGIPRVCGEILPMPYLIELGANHIGGKAISSSTSCPWRQRYAYLNSKGDSITVLFRMLEEKKFRTFKGKRK